MRHILVTGGLGFIGSNLIERLLTNEDNFIYCIDNNFTSSELNMFRSDSVKYIYGNTKDISDLMKNYRIDIVYHLGEYSRIVPSFEDIDYLYDFNCIGTFNVIRFCVDRGIKLIYAASSSKFGDSNNQNLSPYAWYKAKNVELIKNFSEWFGLRYSVAYFYNVYGDRQIQSGKYSAVIGRFMNQYLSCEKLTVVSPGTQRRDFTNVSDIVDGLELLIDRGDGDEFQFGTGKNYSLIEIAEAFGCEYEIVPERIGERFEGVADKDESTIKIGWSAKVDVIDYIKQFVKHINEG